MNTDEVIFNDKGIIKIDNNTISELKIKANSNNSKKFRLCLHKSPQDELHEMIIVHSKDQYIRPHKHMNNTESNYIIEGEMFVIVFDDYGNIKDTFKLSKEENIAFRISKNYWHSIIPLSENVIFIEVKLGPFDKEDNIYPDWAPADNEISKIMEFQGILKSKINDYIAGD